MKGLTIMSDEKSGKRIAQVDLSYLSSKNENIEDLLDVLVAEARIHEKEFSLEAIKKEISKKAKK